MGNGNNPLADIRQTAGQCASVTVGRVRRLQFQSQGYHCNIRKATSLWMPVSSSKAIWLFNSSLTWRLIHLCFSYLHSLFRSISLWETQTGGAFINNQMWMKSHGPLRLGLFVWVSLDIWDSLSQQRSLTWVKTMETHEDTGSYTRDQVQSS